MAEQSDGLEEKADPIQGEKDGSSLGPKTQPVIQAAVSSTAERKDRIDLAVKFLNNPRVQGSPMEQKRVFLKKKGLTDVEVDRAIKLAQTLVSATAVATTNQIAAPPIPPRPPALPPRSRSWQDYAIMAVVFGGVGYAVVQFVRHYVIPWFERPRLQDQKMDDIQASVQELQNSVNTTVASLNESTKAIRDLLSEQQQQLQLLTSQVTTLQSNLPQHANEQALKDIKDELSSLKGLMLNRHQFPTPTRQSSAGIPAWQRAPSNPPQPTTTTPLKAPELNGVDSLDSTNDPPPPDENPQDWHDAADVVN